MKLESNNEQITILGDIPENEAECWVENQASTVNNELTLVLSHYNFPEVEAIYARATGELIMYNIDLDFLNKDSVITVELGNGKNVIIEVCKLPEILELYTYKIGFKGNVKRVGDKEETELCTPRYEIKDNNNEECITMELWLNKYGHMRNQIHVFEGKVENK